MVDWYKEKVDAVYTRCRATGEMCNDTGPCKACSVAVELNHTWGTV